ncbi:MAG TPA: aminotransferase class V-fold PLP-dependent enzyme [Alphaproteobacteria bacterium]|nr:aminotransferase class V-fold PLP-dependent enzyme [Alphaproteobacteria bacterium]
MTSYKPHFSRFIGAAPGRIHLAAHSHHYWPDVTFEAQQQAWLDAARMADGKWEHIFGTVWPKAQGHVARVLNLSDPATVVFAPSTHDFVLRLLSCLPPGRPPRVLTTDSEFHSFSRQMARLEEDGLAVVERVPARPFPTFAERFADAARGGHDLVFLSQVFFNSGYAVPDLGAIAAAVPDDALVAVDGYHGFLAVPTDLRALEDRLFYIAGGYKYAMTGEGACFMHVPARYGARPRNTGWYAAFGALASKQEGVPYAPGGARFMGSTFDQTALYRFNAVMDWLFGLGIGPAEILAHTRALQERFVAALGERPGMPLSADQLLVPLEEANRGQFLTFETPLAGEFQERMRRADLITDHRGDRLRFGFALYHDAEDIAAAVDRMARVLDG